MTTTHRFSNYKIVLTNTLSNVWGTLTKYTMQYQDGAGKQHSMIREVYDSRGDGAAILLYDPMACKVVLISQWRITAFLKSVDSGYLLETVAGLLDDQNPEQTIAKEVLEETGFEVKAVYPIFKCFASPGAHLEQIHLYMGQIEIGNHWNSHGGVESEHEDIVIHYFDYPEVDSLLLSGRIKDSKTVILLQHFLLSKGTGKYGY